MINPLTYIKRDKEELTEKKMKTEIEFEVYPNLKAKAIFIDGVYSGVKLVTKVPRGYYYSFLNDAGKMAEGMFCNA